jgi:hypothetical protein
LPRNADALFSAPAIEYSILIRVVLTNFQPLRAAAMLSAAILLARVIGLAQTSLTSAVMLEMETDAYTAAFRITEFVNYLVAGGALSATFIPVFTQFKDNARPADAWRFFSAIASIMSLVLLLILGLVYAFAEPIAAFATQEPPGEKLDLTVQMTRIMIPAQACFYLGGLLVGVLNAHKRFGASAYTGAVVQHGRAHTGCGRCGLQCGKTPSVAYGILIGAFCGNFLLPLVAALRGPREERVQFRLFAIVSCARCSGILSQFASHYAWRVVSRNRSDCDAVFHGPFARRHFDAARPRQSSYGCGTGNAGASCQRSGFSLSRQRSATGKWIASPSFCAMDCAASCLSHCPPRPC